MSLCFLHVRFACNNSCSCWLPLEKQKFNWVARAVQCECNFRCSWLLFFCLTYLHRRHHGHTGFWRALLLYLWEVNHSLSQVEGHWVGCHTQLQKGLNRLFNTRKMNIYVKKQTDLACEFSPLVRWSRGRRPSRGPGSAGRSERKCCHPCTGTAGAHRRRIEPTCPLEGVRSTFSERKL